MTRVESGCCPRGASLARPQPRGQPSARKRALTIEQPQGGIEAVFATRKNAAHTARQVTRGSTPVAASDSDVVQLSAQVSEPAQRFRQVSFARGPLAPGGR